MSIARLDEVATYDDEGRVEGMQFDGRERRMRQWREQKEDQEFSELIAKLRQKKNWAAWYRRNKMTPGFVQRMREHHKSMYTKHGSQWNAKAASKRKQDADSNPIVNVCDECGQEFVIEFGYKRKRKAKFCTRTCRNRHHHKIRSRSKDNRKDEVLRLVQSRYSVTATEATAVLNMSLAQVRSLLNWLAKGGQINKHTDSLPFRYSVW